MEKKWSNRPCVRGVKVENAKEMKEACRTMAEIHSPEACHQRFLPDPVKKRGTGETGGSDAYSMLGPGTGMSLLVKGSLPLHMTLPIAEHLTNDWTDHRRLADWRRPCSLPSRATFDAQQQHSIQA